MELQIGTRAKESQSRRSVLLAFFPPMSLSLHSGFEIGNLEMPVKASGFRVVNCGLKEEARS
jgi:hypothetical protein